MKKPEWNFVIKKKLWKSIRMRSFKENKKDSNRFILQQKEGNRLKPRTVKKGFLGVMGLFLLSALTPALIPFAVDKTAILHRSDMRRGHCFARSSAWNRSIFVFGEKGEASDRTGRKTETSVSDLLFQ